MTSQGSPTARFRRALGTGNPTLVLEAAAEMPRVELDDALAVCLVLARERDRRFGRAAGRWLGRLILERGLPVEQRLRAATALIELGAAPGDAAPRATLELLLQGGSASTQRRWRGDQRV